MLKIILASASPRRRELLERIGLSDFEVRVSDADETIPPGLGRRAAVEHVSRVKARAVPSRDEELLIAADTMVFLGNARMGKPRDEAEALSMLTDLQGQRHTVCTGVTLRQGQRMLTESEETAVFFRPATREQLLRYIATGEPMDKAGAYGVQGRGALLVDRLEGDFFNVMGLPVARLSRMLESFGVVLL